MKRIRKHLVQLTASERSTLQAFVSSGQKKAREITRARILLLADAGHTDADQLVKLEMVESISHERVRQALKKTA